MAKDLPPVAEWMMMSQEEVLNKFLTLPGAYTDGEGQNAFVYVPGTRNDRVLLVAHTDTVYPNIPGLVKIGFVDGILYSKNRTQSLTIPTKYGSRIINGVGIGADDRAGCAILWELRKLGHSILLTSGEEQGCIATKFIMESEWWYKELNTTHSFAVEFDRRNSKDIVFYRVGTNDFVKYVKSETHYKPEAGSVTDISHLCKLICGVNLSVGYYNEHTTEEKLVLNQWQNTLATAANWLSKPNLPHFPLDKNQIYDPDKEKWERWQKENAKRQEEITRKYNLSNDYRQKPYEHNNKKKEEESIKERKNSDYSDSFVECPRCHHTMEENEWFKNFFKCVACDKEF